MEAGAAAAAAADPAERFGREARAVVENALGELPQEPRPADDPRRWAGQGLGLGADGKAPEGEVAARHAAMELARGAARGTALGLAGKGALSLAMALLKGRKASSQSLVQAVAGKDTLRFAAFLGGFVGLFRLSNALATWYLGRDAPRNSAFAGAVAGVALLVDARERRKMISLYLLSRASDVVVRMLVRKGVLPYWRHFEALMFGVSNMPIMFGFLFEPEILQKGYYQWILNMGNIKDEGLEKTLRVRRKLHAAGGHMPFQPCSAGYHEGPCTAYCVTDWFLGLGRAAKIYASVHLLSLAFRRRALMADPKAQLLRTATGIAGSCAFLSTYVFFVKASQCFLRNLRQEDAGWHALLAGLLTGLSTYFEKPSRVSELMLYCLPRGAEAAWLYLERRDMVRSVGGFEAVFFMAAMAALASGARADFKPAYHDSLCFVLGSKAQHPREAPMEEAVEAEAR